ncbi:uncharacterized protein Dvar_18780 [Desulfosarcina variabilis str. Montpellier]
MVLSAGHTPGHLHALRRGLDETETIQTPVGRRRKPICPECLPKHHFPWWKNAKDQRQNVK